MRLSIFFLFGGMNNEQNQERIQQGQGICKGT